MKQKCEKAHLTNTCLMSVAKKFSVPFSEYSRENRWTKKRDCFISHVLYLKPLMFEDLVYVALIQSLGYASSQS